LDGAGAFSLSTVGTGGGLGWLPAEFGLRCSVIGALRSFLKLSQVQHRSFLGGPSANSETLAVRVNVFDLVGPSDGDDPVSAHS
jgi:hypothetical protein